MSVYSSLLDAVENGKSYEINFKTKYLEVDGKVLVKDGISEEPYGFSECTPEKIEELYEEFLLSRPGKTSQKSYFIPMSLSEMSDIQMYAGENRMVAQAKLEGAMLGLLLEKCPFKTFTGTANNAHYMAFWQSKKFPTLVIWKEWFKEE